jgi:ABC-type amino acid transport substrate-binding protein
VKGKFLLSPRVLGALLTLTSLPQTAWSSPNEIVVCYPGGPVGENEADTAMAAMLRVVERVGEWPADSFTSIFSARSDECRNLLDSRKPSFAITSLGLFLEQRDAHHLTPIVQPRMKGATSERYRLMIRQGQFSSLDDLKGKSVSGTVLDEPEFLEKIVFGGQINPATYFDLKPTRQAIRALRSLDKGELDAVLLNGQQYAALGSLPLKSPLEVVYTSVETPLMGMVANAQTTKAEDRERFAKALQKMCSDTDGKKLCELFGVEAFVPANAAAIEPMIKLWQKGK